MKRAIFEAKTRLLMRSDRRAYAQMLEDERVPAVKAREISEQRSARIARHAYRTSPFYRELYDAAGFSEEDVARPENFSELPALTKELVQEAGDALISSASSQSDRLVSRTGGSTGRPLQVYNDRSAPTAALWWRIYSWWGIHPADDAAFIYRQSRRGMSKLRYDAEWWPTKHVLLDARGATAETIAEFDARMRKVRPRLLVGYVEGVVDYAEHVRTSGWIGGSIAAVSVTASMLHEGQRELIEDVLRAPVFDTYRSAEIPWIAAQCEARDGLHVLSDRRRVDVVGHDGRAAPDGEVGTLLVTDFDNSVFPLVRYAIGDRARTLTTACACGRTLARISQIEGRIADVLRTPSGRSVSGGLGGLFNSWPGVVRQFQVHQRADFSIVIRYIAGEDLTAAQAAAAEVRDTVSRFLKDEVKVEAVAVDEIASVGGKARLVISEAPGRAVS